MEEILASIRRIIADDQSLPGRAGADAPDAEPHIEAAPHRPEIGADESDAEAAVPEEVAMHVLRTPSLDAAMPHGMSDADPNALGHGVRAPQFAVSDVPDLGLTMSPETPEVARTSAGDLETAFAEMVPPDAAPSPDPVPPLVHAEARAPSDNLFSTAVDSSLTTAFNTLAASRLVANSDELMGLVREMIRPLLKAWVDEHVPSVIERLVGAEIERIARGGL